MIAWRQGTGKDGKKVYIEDFPGGTVDKNPAGNVGDKSLIPGAGRLHVLQGN